MVNQGPRPRRDDAAAQDWPRAAGLCLALTLSWVVPGLAQSSRQVTVTISEGTSMAAALSPDGQTLAIDLLGSIWTLPAGGGAARRVTGELADARQPAWSPDGRRIAFQSYRTGTWHIWSIEADGTDLQQHTFGVFDHREPAWSSDGRRLAFSSDRAGNYDIWELSLASAQLIRRTEDPANDFSPTWGPNDRTIGFVSTRAAGRGLWEVAASGTARQLVSMAGTLSPPAWSPDARSIAFTATEAGQSRLIAAPVVAAGEAPAEAADVIEISDPGEDVFPFRPAWSSGDELLYTADGRIKRRTLDGDRPSLVGFTAAVDLERDDYRRRPRGVDPTSARPVRGLVAPAVSPDGSRIAFVALGDLWTAATDGTGEPSQLTQDPFLELTPAWAPDGTRLVFATDRTGTMDLWIRDLSSGQERRLTTSPGGESMPAWSPDGTRIAFLTDAGNVQFVDVATASVETVRASLFRPGRPSWSRDGQLLAISALRPYSTRFREGRNEILLLPLDVGRERYVTPLPHQSIGARGTDGPVWSPDGRAMAFVADGVLSIADVAPDGTPLSAPPRRVTAEVATSLSWTADSRYLFYQTATGIWRFARDDGRREPIPLAMSWTPEHPSDQLTLHAGRIFDGRSDTLLEDMDILVRGHRIEAIEPHDETLHSARTLDAGDATVLPGLIEVHTHQREAYGEALGRIWLAYGITTVREPAADPYASLERRESIRSGRRLGPRELFTGSTLDGPRIYYSGAAPLVSTGYVDGALEQARQLEYDLIKTYVRLPDAVQRRVVEFAHAHGMPVTSHELYPAVAYGTDGVEHIGGTSRRGYSPKHSLLRRSYQDVIQLLAQSGMTLTPTIGIMGGFGVIANDDPSILEDRRLRTLFPASVGQSVADRLRRAQADLGLARARLAPLEETVKRVIDAGGRVLAGTDAPIIPYGLSLHTELEHFVRGGVSAADALRTATLAAAEGIGMGDDLGTIEPGKLADLVVVEGNPLEDIRDTRRVRLVIANGAPHTVDDLLRRPSSR